LSVNVRGLPELTCRTLQLTMETSGSRLAANRLVAIVDELAGDIGM
jgi:hypothetical protein